jgi:hypothetical protein
VHLKLHFFPAAFPDETLHSVISRYTRLCGVRNCQAAFAGLKSAAAFSQNVAFPSHLGDFVDALPSGTELSVAEVLMRHTLLPYYAPFLRMSQVEHARTLMTADGKGLMLKLGVNASRIGFASRVRLCPECIAQDQAQRGVAYWHRVHMLPGVLVCPHHGTSLRILDPRWSSRSSRQLNLPNDGNVQAHTVLLDTPLRCMPPLHEIALRSLQVLESEVTALSAEAVRCTLLHRATQLNLASDNHRLHLHMLAEHMTDFFAALPQEWEFSILGEVRAGTPASWVTKLLRTPITSHHPLKYILLAGALGIDMVSLLHGQCPVKQAVACGPEAHIRLPTRPSAVMPGQGLDCSSAAVWRHALEGADAKKIAAVLSVSLAYVYRHIRNVPGGQDDWREARFHIELFARRAAFEADYRFYKAHACRGYAWLYRHDRQWLSESTANPSPHRTPRLNSTEMFAALDARLAGEVRQCADALYALAGKPVRISRTRIGRELHVLSRFEKQLCKLPLCAAMLDKVCEPIEGFHDRRLRWARCQLLSEGKPVSRSSLYRVASIRPML